MPLESLGPTTPRCLVLDLPLTTDVVDQSIYGHDGVPSGAAVFDDGAMACNGTFECGAVVAHRPNLILPAPWTIACAVKIAYANLGGLHSLVALDVAAEWAPPYCHAWLTVEYAGRLAVAAGGDLSLVGTINLADGEWHHVAAVYTGRRLELYVDGASDGGVDWQGRYVPTRQSLFLGQHPSTNEHLIGRLANVKLYRVALNATAVAALAVADSPSA